MTLLEGYLNSIRMRHQGTGDDSGLRHQSTNLRHQGTNGPVDNDAALFREGVTRVRMQRYKPYAEWPV